jgi:transcriptional antiterminator NusG
MSGVAAMGTEKAMSDEMIESTDQASQPEELVTEEAEVSPEEPAVEAAPAEAEIAPAEAAAAEVEAEEVEEGPPPVELEIEGMGWYVVHTYSGYENKAKLALTERMKTLDYEEYFGSILVPEEQVVERTKTGKTRNVSKRFYPGYMLVQMDLTNETWHVVKDTPKVTGFVGGNNRKPSQVPPHEVERILGLISKEAVETKPKIHFDKGENIRVVDGPFANFNGVVDEVRPDKGKLRVLVSIFGRSTPVELDYIQVQKD